MELVLELVVFWGCWDGMNMFCMQGHEFGEVRAECYGLIVFFQNSYVEALTSDVIEFGGGAFGKY